jgi:outer membrane protein TolC
MPSELLERRPDVIAAERRVAAAFYRVEEAKAARLPRISLTAAVDQHLERALRAQDRDNPVWSAGASLTAPLFLGGQLQAQVEIRTAEQKQALAEYGRVGARAFGEVENALSQRFRLEEREDILTRVGRGNCTRARARERALPRRRGRPARGAAAEPRAHAARTALLRVQAERLVQRVNLHLALGGSFTQSQ